MQTVLGDLAGVSCVYLLKYGGEGNEDKDDVEWEVQTITTGTPARRDLWLGRRYHHYTD